MLLFADLIQNSQEKYIVLNIVHSKKQLKRRIFFLQSNQIRTRMYFGRQITFFILRKLNRNKKISVYKHLLYM